jgi:hypothetical protein
MAAMVLDHHTAVAVVAAQVDQVQMVHLLEERVVLALRQQFLVLLSLMLAAVVVDIKLLVLVVLVAEETVDLEILAELLEQQVSVAAVAAVVVQEEMEETVGQVLLFSNTINKIQLQYQTLGFSATHQHGLHQLEHH